MTLLAEPVPGSKPSVKEIPLRFRTAPTTLFWDRFMNHFIKIGGVGIILAVLGIFIFIFSQTLPLFSSAHVQPSKTYNFQTEDGIFMAADEWGEMPFIISKDGTVRFYDARTGSNTLTFDPLAETGQTVTAFQYNARHSKIIYGTSAGSVFYLDILYRPEFRDDKRKIVVTTELSPILETGLSSPVVDLGLGDQGDAAILGMIQETPEGNTIRAISMRREQTLLGSGELTIESVSDLTSLIKGNPIKILVNSSADGFAVATQTQVFYLTRSGDSEFSLRQSFEPFGDLENQNISSMDYLFGEVSLVFTNAEGVNRIFSLYIHQKGGRRVFGLTKNFESLPEGATYFDASLRNKAFLIGNGNFASLRYSTTEAIRWEAQMPFEVQSAAIGRKYDSLFFLDSAGKVHVYNLEDHHPEAGWKAYFGKIWYEGYARPSYDWQSTGGTDDFEPKLSLIPLILGTFKGTLYAMLFALPIALLAAIYTSQFAHPKFKFLVKPTMEIMASLPSVVLGFLAALWLAPLLEDKIPSLILVTLFIPLFSFSFGWAWTSLPIRYRRLIPAGYEWIFMMPVLLLCCYLGWVGGPVLERLLFTVADPVTGNQIADFRLWWPHVTGTPFEQRNSLVVGFMMGFAVIPIIFTITEDSLSNVPRVLVSGSLALGASRWQTAIQVVLPTAFPGIFSAIMIGLGRAVGETMIVVMATGNTPIMDLNIFSGMRTLSANIAVELPEAPYLGTLYRSLFLGAVVLFVMTFFVNTGAEIIRQHLREKYKTV